MSGNYDWPRFKVAAVQAGPVLKDEPQYFDAGATLEKAVSLIEEAGKNGARLVVFPECWMPAFPYWCLDYRDRGRFVDIWAKYLWSSVEVPGRETEALGAAAKRANAYVVLGINERDAKFAGRMYNSMLYINSRGEVMGTHRKICNTVQERLFHTPGDGGANLETVFKTDIGNLGGLMCGEHSQLLLSHHWIMQGIQVHCALWPGRTGLETITDVKTRAFCITAGAFGVLAATYIPEKDQPKNFFPNSLFSTPNGFKGGSGIVSPGGRYIAGPVYDKETIVYGDVDLAEVDRSHSTANLTGVYSRWDLLSLNVQQSTYQPAVPMANTRLQAGASEASTVRDLEARLRLMEQEMAAVKNGQAVK